jgi:hypothetical protein
VTATDDGVQLPKVYDDPLLVAVAEVVGATVSNVQPVLLPESVKRAVLVASMAVPVLFESLTSM